MTTHSLPDDAAHEIARTSHSIVLFTVLVVERLTIGCVSSVAMWAVDQIGGYAFEAAPHFRLLGSRLLSVLLNPGTLSAYVVLAAGGVLAWTTLARRPLSRYGKGMLIAAAAAQALYAIFTMFLVVADGLDLGPLMLGTTLDIMFLLIAWQLVSRVLGERWFNRRAPR